MLLLLIVFIIVLLPLSIAVYDIAIAGPKLPPIEKVNRQKDTLSTAAAGGVTKKQPSVRSVNCTTQTPVSQCE